MKEMHRKENLSDFDFVFQSKLIGDFVIGAIKAWVVALMIYGAEVVSRRKND